jgi:formylglycine-generating enzyme required for sulfatase activity
MKQGHKSSPLILPIMIITGILLAGCEGAQEEESQAHADCVAPEMAPQKLQAGQFIMGAHPAYQEEGPPKRVSVAAFSIDATEVTNAQFARFVAATGYVSDAEKPQAGFGVAGAVVFRMPSVTNPSWWHFVEGANWRHPEGPQSSIKGRANEPVVQVSFNDAQAYAAWAGRRLPSEAEWEYAAAGGAETIYVWGDTRTKDEEEMANTWQGSFPIHNSAADGFTARAPVGCFPPNDFALYDMIGNVWEWTDSDFIGAPDSLTGDKIYTIKGGSFLCAPNFCRRYRAAARQAQEAGLPTNHIGFRTVQSGGL